MTFLSLIGFVALAGVVVNNSLILVEFSNEMREKGVSLLDSLAKAGRLRLLPIVLTTVTTLAGLAPLMLEPLSAHAPTGAGERSQDIGRR